MFCFFFAKKKSKQSDKKMQAKKVKSPQFEIMDIFILLHFLFFSFFEKKQIEKNKKFSFFFPTKPGHFSRTLSKGPNTTTWIWNLHADAHDFDSHTSDLEEISRKVFSAHFGQLGVIFIWLSGCETILQK